MEKPAQVFSSEGPLSSTGRGAKSLKRNRDFIAKSERITYSAISIEFLRGNIVKYLNRLFQLEIIT